MEVVWPPGISSDMAWGFLAVATTTIVIFVLKNRFKSTHVIDSVVDCSCNPPLDISPKSVLDQLGQTERLQLQSKVANATTAEDFYSIFDDFHILHRLDLLDAEDEGSVEKGDRDASAEQAFRDLVRDKVNINDESVVITPEQSSCPTVFRGYFLELVLGVVEKQQETSRQQSEEAKEGGSCGLSRECVDSKVVATHICQHLARTRAGGDSFFCVSALFQSPQLLITASHTDTHPPTDLHTSEDGWAFITTTSNFDVYLAKDLSDPERTPPSELDEGEATCLGISHVDSMCHGAEGSERSEERMGLTCQPLVTLSARLEEAIPVTAEAQREQHHRTLSSTPSPYYRTLSIVCFDPCDPSHFRGGGGGKTVGVSVRRCSPIAPVKRGNVTASTSSSASEGAASHHPNNHVFRRRGRGLPRGGGQNRPIDSLAITTGTE